MKTENKASYLKVATESDKNFLQFIHKTLAPLILLIFYQKYSFSKWSAKILIYKISF